MCRKLVFLLMALCLLCTLTACGGETQTDTPSTTTPTTTTTTTTTTTNPAKAPTFAAMPQKMQEMAEVYRLSDTVALFAFITPGMDASLTELVSYDVSADTLLGQLDLGETWVGIFPQEDGFTLFDYDRKTYTAYDTACQQISTVTLDFEGAVGDILPNGDHLLVSDMHSGQYHIYDLTTHTTTPVDETVWAADFTCKGTYKDAFLLHSYVSGIIAVTADGKRQTLNTVAKSAQAIGSAYAVGVQGDYAVFYPFVGGDTVMCPVRGDAETFHSAWGNGYLSRSGGEQNALHYYDLNRRTVTDAPMTSHVVDAAVFGSAAVAVLYPGEGQALTYAYVDFSALTAVSMITSAYDNTVIEDRRPLPAVSGVAAEVLNLYGITVIGDANFFDMSPYGYTITAATDEQIADRTALLKEYLTFFPEGVFKEMSQRAPVVIVLCNELSNTAGGMNTYIDGYNVTFLSVDGTDDYFCGVASHELAHALEHGIAPVDLEGWAKMQPPDVLAAYDDRYLTVEYTVDDKGRTPVWFTDAYGRTNAMEDRATVFEEMYTAWVSGDTSSLDYEGLQKKVEYWSYMLRNNFTCCQDTTFTWDGLFA